MKLEIPVSAREFVEEHAKLTPMRIILALVFGGLALAIFGAAVVRERGGRSLPFRKSRPLLTVEEAVRWRAC
jgi:hypothetical protein